MQFSPETICCTWNCQKGKTDWQSFNIHEVQHMVAVTVFKPHFSCMVLGIVPSQLGARQWAQLISKPSYSTDDDRWQLTMPAGFCYCTSSMLLLYFQHAVMAYVRKDMASGSRWPANRRSSVSGRCMSGNFSPAKRWFRMNMSVCWVVRGPEVKD